MAKQIVVLWGEGGQCTFSNVTLVKALQEEFLGIPIEIVDCFGCVLEHIKNNTDSLIFIVESQFAGCKPHKHIHNKHTIASFYANIQNNPKYKEIPIVIRVIPGNSLIEEENLSTHTKVFGFYSKREDIIQSVREYIE
jgi:hypothetical protein